MHEKTTYTSRVNAKTAAMRKIADEGDDEFVEEEKKKEKDGVIAVKDDPQFTLAITRGTCTYWGNHFIYHSQISYQGFSKGPATGFNFIS